MVRLSVAVESQPAAFGSICVYDPEEVIVCPSQMKLSHATMVDVPDDVSLIVNIIVSDTFPQGGFP